MVKRLWSNIDLKAAILVLVGVNCALKGTVRHKEGYISRHDRDCSWHKMKNKCRLIRPRPERSSFKMTQRRVGSNTLVSPAEVTVSWILNLLWCQHTLQKFVAPQKGLWKSLNCYRSFTTTRALRSSRSQRWRSWETSEWLTVRSSSDFHWCLTEMKSLAECSSPFNE